jgi:hypothetical protein
VKVCSKCRASKPLTDFYLKDKAAGRFSGQCKKCDMEHVKAHRADHLEYYRNIDKNRAMLPHRVAARDKWASQYPERFIARHIVKNAIKAKRLTKQPCLICGNKAQAHHPDYSAPLEVVWLCDPHHKQAHAMAKDA